MDKDLLYFVVAIVAVITLVVILATAPRYSSSLCPNVATPGSTQRNADLGVGNDNR